MPRPKGEDRARSLANLLGADAERLALLLLILKGYWPLARRYRAAGGEIDLLVRRGRTIVAVEVKARATLELAAGTIDGWKLKRIGAALRAFRTERQLDDRHHFRCDAILIAPRRWPRHILDVGSVD